MDQQFRAQIEKFKAEDEARWRYQAEEEQRQFKILKGLGRTDEHVKEEMRRAGINVSILEEEAEKEARNFIQAHREISKITPPPIRAKKDSFTLQRFASLAHTHQWLYPPAADGWGNAEECGFNLELGEINLERHSTGSGWGLQAVAYGTQYCTLIFPYFPPTSGELTVEPHVDFQGEVALSAHDHWYTSTHAELLLKLHFDLFQHYWDGEVTATIVNEHRHDSSTAYWVDDHRILSKSLSVSAGNVVWIKLTVSLYVVAHSSHATVDCNFRTGAERRIRVEHIRVKLDSDRPVLASRI